MANHNKCSTLSVSYFSPHVRALLIFSRRWKLCRERERERERSQMAKIHVISTWTVQSATANTNESIRRIELTPWDLQFLLTGNIQKGLLFLEPPPQREQSENTTVHHLKTSLSRTLDFFPLFAGRLSAIKNDDDDTTSFFIDCNNAGAQFTHATVGLTVADILQPTYVPSIVHSFFPLNGVRNHEAITKPLLAVQVTELLDGFFIGCTMNHSVADGTSFWHFFNSWSEISRGYDRISKPVVLKRWFPDDTVDCPIRIPLCNEDLVDKFIPPALKERVFHFTKGSIAKLKAKANAEMGTDRISSLQVVLAHLWRSVMRCRHVDVDEEVKLNLLIGARPRLRPPLPEGYVGNSIHVAAVMTKARELLEHGLGWVAWQINEVVSLQTQEEVRNFYDSWVARPKILKMGTYVTNAIGTSSSPRFNVYGTDFGWGKPVAVRSGAGNKFDGKLTLFPGVEEGSVDVEVCLLPEKLHALCDDAEFMDAVAI